MFTNAEIDNRVFPTSLEPEVRVAVWCWEATVGTRVLVHMVVFVGMSVWSDDLCISFDFDLEVVLNCGSC